MSLVADAVPLEELVLSDGYAALGAAFVQRLDPTPLHEPKLAAFNPEVASLVGLRSDQAGRPEFVRLAAGNARFRSVQPFAAVYAGHQFGTFVPQLGDGRAITLGEVAGPNGPFEWQLKGAGTTAFSRFGDGRAVLRSTIREYLCSEAMAALGIPTTRALALAVSDDPVFRETRETAAVLTRVAPSHLRFGSFEFFRHRADDANLKLLADYAIERFFPAAFAHEAGPSRYAAFLRDVVVRTAELMAQWQAAGFAHGVMNTDNMSILGLTLDYGPFGFLDTYDPQFICNHTDEGGRYAFERQPTIGLWNCHAFAGALAPLVLETDANDALAAYEPAFRDAYLALLRAKFGFAGAEADDAALMGSCFVAMRDGAADYTRFFRALCAVAATPGPADDAAGAEFTDRSGFDAWLPRYRARLVRDGRADTERGAAMRAANPKFVLRNYLAQQAISAAENGDFGELERLHAVLRRPFDDQPERESYAAGPPEWASGIAVSCSS